ncbi:AraC family transcriptional regulator [Clostridium sp. MSJ-8]|uniref:AraC family transcriptional regulator n=1 Tax=Clostridium sp. MSJ-8 TaxID=2841510 RepID=UPI001C0ED17A|nr:AraC family transcriptional regulator [Clostridium sp. MSJ-8]MBU5488273.1 AraC family transcriptional regulator [Clostridium sp. MSJ-8]
MYDVFESDSYFFNNDVFNIIEAKDKEALIELIKQKHTWENTDNIPVLTKKNDLIMWNVVFCREVIKKGSTKQYLHPLYNKFYKSILSCTTLQSLQKLELNLASSYYDLLVNFVEVTDNFIINKIVSYLYTHIENHLSLEEIADDLHISMGYLSSCFKKNMGISVMNYYKKIKIDRSKSLLMNGNKSILEISTLLGFCDQGHFTKVFKSIVGMTPTEYRNMSR